MAGDACALHRCGWHNYSLFLDGDGTLFGYFETDGTLGDAVRAMQSEPVNERWQALMAPYFVDGGDAADHQMQRARRGVPPAMSGERAFWARRFSKSGTSAPSCGQTKR